MDTISHLQIKKKLNKLKHLNEDFNYTEEIIEIADNSFKENLDRILKNNPKIKSAYEKKVNEKIDEEILKNINFDSTANFDVSENNEEKSEKIEKSNKVKTLFRKIVKLTHPDIVNDIELNKIYIEASSLYENNDKVNLYKICNKLNIDYEFDDEDKEEIDKEINKIKEKINFLESTFAWVWFNAEDKKKKDSIVLDFINRNIK